MKRTNIKRHNPVSTEQNHAKTSTQKSDITHKHQAIFEFDQDDMIEVVLLSFKLDERALNDQVLDEAYAQICKTDHPHRIILHPGVGYKKDFMWPKSPSSIKQTAKKYGVSAFFEAHDPERNEAYYFAYQHADHLDRMEPAQLFGTSKVANQKKPLINQLIAHSQQQGERVAQVRGVPFGFMMCGENNLLVNQQSQQNRVSVRHHPELDVFDHVRCVVNGAHTTMGNWGKLERRFEYLSRNERFCFYLTNRSDNTWKTALRVYYNSERLVDGKVILNSNRFKSKLIIDPADRYRAISIHLPYELMK